MFTFPQGHFQTNYTLRMPNPLDDSTVKATTSFPLALYSPSNFFDDNAGTTWATGANGIVSNQKMNVKFENAFILKKIEYMSLGVYNPPRDPKAFIVYGSNSQSAFENTVFSDLTNLTEIFEAEFQAANPAQMFSFDIGFNNLSFQYYIFRLFNNWGATDYMEARGVNLYS